MKSIGTQAIETDRLVLRRFRENDAQAMFDNWASDDDVTKYVTWPSYRSSDECLSYIRDVIAPTYSDNDAYHWVIELKEIGEAVGSIGAVDVNKALDSVEIGYCLGRSWWHKGIMSEALAALIAFFFTQAEVNRIVASHDVRNVNSGGVMLKCGMKHEGTLRQSGRNNQGICDMAVYSILRDEYLSDIK